MSSAGGPLRPRVGRAAIPVVALLLLALAVFAALAFRIHEQHPPFWDARLLDALAPERGGTVRDTLRFLARVTGEYRGLALAAIVVVLLLGRRRPAAAAGFSLLLGLTIATVLALKPHFPRPSLVAGNAGYFPSTHAAGSVVIGLGVAALAVDTRWRRPVTLLCAAAVIVYGAALVESRSHYPSDVVAGWCTALAWWAAGVTLSTAVRARLSTRR